MRRWEALLATAGIFLLSLGTYFVRRSALPKTDIVLDGRNCHTPATLFEPPPGVPALGSAILVHGLAANRVTMKYLGTDFAGHGFRVYLLDLPGHGDNQQPFTFARAQECADAVVAELVASGRIDPKKTMLVGHSLGGAIVIRMADREPMAATIAIAPSPIVAPTRMPGNLLILSGQYDIRVLRREAQALSAAAGGNRTAPADFAEQRAFELQDIPGATHTSPLLDRNVAHEAEEWAMRALFPAVGLKTLDLNLALATYDTFNRGRRRLAGALMGFVGLIVLFPACSALVLKSLGAKRLEITPSQPSQSELINARPSRGLALAETTVCALGSVLILAVAVPLRFIHLYSGDYLASLLVLAAAMQLGLNWKFVRPISEVNGSAIFGAIALGLAAVLAVGAWLSWQLADLWLNEPRWVRFAVLLPLMWVFSFAEEAVLGPVKRGKQRAARFGTFLAMRFVLWLACVLAYFTLDSGQALLAILVVTFAAFSVLQRLATDLIRERTGSAIASAALGAILAAWFIAAVFPLT